MGSSQSLPQPPLPNIAIFLKDASDKVYKPDDLVSGHVAFTPANTISPHAIEASLFGVSLIWLRTETTDSNNNTTYYHWRDNAPLFEVSENILPKDEKGQGQRTFEPGQTYNFPFSFQFPVGTMNTRSGQYKNSAAAKWTVGPHKLPPSFLYTSKYGDGQKKPDWAKIEYGIRVKLICFGVGVVQGLNMVDFTTTRPIPFQPLEECTQKAIAGLTGVQRFERSFTLQKSTLTGKAASQIGFRQGLRDHFSSATPKLDFKAAIEIPDLLNSGTEFRFRATFTVLSKSDNVVQIPPVQFTVLRLTLKNFIDIRANRDPDATDRMDGHHKSNKFEFLPSPAAPFVKRDREICLKEETHLNSVPRTFIVELVDVPSYEKKEQMEQANSCETWFTARVPSTTSPSFNSFAIAKTYKVKIKMCVEVGGKRFEVEAKSLVKEMGSAPM